MIVLDANILIRAILGRRVRQIIDTYEPQGLRFFTPDVAFDDAGKYLPLLLKKRGMSKNHGESPGCKPISKLIAISAAAGQRRSNLLTMTQNNRQNRELCNKPINYRHLADGRVNLPASTIPRIHIFRRNNL